MNDDLNSEFEYDSEAESKRRKRLDLAVKGEKPHQSKAGKRFFEAEKSREEGKKRSVLQQDVYSRHKELINQYLLCYAGATQSHLQRDTSRDRTDADVIRENHKFLWDDSNDAATWEQKLAKKYYDKLFKEYCIADLSRYKENKVAMRWRTEKEVIDGKGQFVCGEKRCKEFEGLASWEVNFGYIEDGKKRNALVKLRLCPDCSYRLNYFTKKRQVFKKPKRKSGSKKLKLESPEGSSGKGESSKSEDAETEVKVKEEPEPVNEAAAKELWSQPVEVEEDKSREDEIDEFLEDMFL